MVLLLFIKNIRLVGLFCLFRVNMVMFEYLDLEIVCLVMVKKLSLDIFFNMRSLMCFVKIYGYNLVINN